VTGGGTLAHAVERVESVRDVKDVQRHLAHAVQVGDVAQAIDLFTDDAEVRWGDERLTGRAAVGAWIERTLRRWGALHTEVVDQPLVTLSADGRTARGRWHGMRFLGDGAGGARIEAGIYENRYARTGGGWRIAAVDHTPLYAGDYTDGWTNVDPEGVPIVPRHFTADEVGAPVGEVPEITGSGSDDVDALAARIARLNDEDDVRNLVHALGYYVDRRMWTDVVDLFDDDSAADAAVRVGGAEYTGPQGVRDACATMGPEGLRRGELNDWPIFDLVVDVDGAQARVRGITVGLLGDANRGTGYWEFARFGGVLVKRDGLWRMKSVTVTRMVRAEYADGWGHQRAVRRGEAGPLSRRVRARCGPDAPGHPADVRLADLARRLARSRAYDAVENVSAAYGYYLDDFQWPELARLFAVCGHKQSPFVGYYVGRDRILEAAVAARGARRRADAWRERAVFHWRPQSVVHVSHDARSANLRTRLLQTRTASRVDPDWTGLHGGCYPNDQAVLEDGVWRLWSVTIDEYSFVSPTWHGGWAAAGDGRATARPDRSRLVEACPPDIAMPELGARVEGLLGGVGRPRVWPEIAPMWFGYRNPVSGRTPERYWPDCAPSRAVPGTSMTRHGYELPPTGPAVDGVEVA